MDCIFLKLHRSCFCGTRFITVSTNPYC